MLRPFDLFGGLWGKWVVSEHEYNFHKISKTDLLLGFGVLGVSGMHYFLSIYVVVFVFICLFVLLQDLVIFVQRSSNLFFFSLCLIMNTLYEIPFIEILSHKNKMVVHFVRQITTKLLVISSVLIVG